MPLSGRLDARTESLIGRLARKRRQTKSEVIRAFPLSSFHAISDFPSTD